MKPLTLTSTLTISVVLLISAAIMLLESCDTYHFEKPLPSDSKNLYEFPKEFRGTWINDLDTVIIGKNFYEVASHEKGKIINLTRIVDPRDTVRKAKGTGGRHVHFENIRTVTLDSTGKAGDTVVNFIIKGGRIYHLEDEKLERGARFVIKGDTIYCLENERLKIELNGNIFLRHVSGSYYIINMREGETFAPEHQWWKIYLLNRNADGTVVVSDIRNEFDNGPGLIHSIDRAYYYNGQWTKKDVDKLIKDSVFTDHTFKLKESMKIRKK